MILPVYGNLKRNSDNEIVAEAVYGWTGHDITPGKDVRSGDSIILKEWAPDGIEIPVNVIRVGREFKRSGEGKRIYLYLEQTAELCDVMKVVEAK